MNVIPYFMARRRLGSAAGGGGGTDPHWASVVLLVMPDAPNGTTTFTDLSASAKTLTTHGNANILNDKIELDGTGDAVSAADSADWLFDGDFTIEVFDGETDTILNDKTYVSQYDNGDSNRSWLIHHNNASGLTGGAVSTSGSSNINCYETFTPSSAGVGYAFCLERSGTTLRFYRDGVMTASATASGSLFNSNERMVIGARRGTTLSEPLNGRIAAVRITKGVARYASDGGYTVPSLPLLMG